MTSASSALSPPDPNLCDEASGDPFDAAHVAVKGEP